MTTQGNSFRFAPHLAVFAGLFFCLSLAVAQTATDSEAQMQECIARLEARMQERIAQLEARMQERIAQLEARIAQLESQPREAPQTVKRSTKAYLGAKVRQLTAEVRYLLNLEKDEGVLICDVAIDSPATRAGLARMDIVLSIEGRKVGEPEEFQRWIESYSPGQSIKIVVLSKGARREFVVSLADAGAEREESLLPFLTEEDLARLRKLLGRFEKELDPNSERLWRELSEKGKRYWEDLGQDPLMGEEFRRRLEKALRAVDSGKYEEILDELTEELEEGNFKELLRRVFPGRKEEPRERD